MATKNETKIYHIIIIFLFAFMHFPGQPLVECFVSYPLKTKQKSFAPLSKTKKTLVSNLFICDLFVSRGDPLMS